MTPAWPWALALTIALGALIVSQVQLRDCSAGPRHTPILLPPEAGSLLGGTR